MVIAKESRHLSDLHAELVRNGFVCQIISFDEDVIEQASRQSPDAVLVEVNGYSPHSEIWQLVRRIKEGGPSPLIALVTGDALGGIDGNPDVDDFLTGPYDAAELVLRIKRLLGRSGVAENNEIIRCDDLVIDLARYEVSVGGKKVELTFKEYELLRCLASNRGRVYTREALLDKVWGLDYYGGDRTVDVHVRRLRSKIESPRHDFIETVRNIGYRFKKDF